MRFLHQIKFEIRNIIRSKFLLIIGILIILAGIAVPVIGLFGGRQGNINPIEPVLKTQARDILEDSAIAPGYEDVETITVKGVTIRADNPYYWYIQNLLSEQASFENNKGQFSSPAVVDLLLEMVDMEIDYYLHFAQYISSYNDYRSELAWRGQESLNDKFFYEKTDVKLEVILEAASYRKGIDPEYFKTKFIDITPIERMEGLAKADEYLDLLYAIVDNNDFAKYIDLRIKMEQDQIESYLETIAIQEKNIIENPSQEDNLNNYIKELRKQIEIIETNNIPMLQYRLEKNIIPGIDVWQNSAIADIENSRSQLVYMTIMTEEEFNQMHQGGGQDDRVFAEGYDLYYEKYYYYPGYGYGYDTYQEYVAYMEAQIAKLNKTIIIAQMSLDADKPDMKYVPEGSRSRAISFLDYSIIVALFGVLIGGWLIASEHQQGTIRLLMIRPRTRAKILMAKFSAAVMVCLAVYISGSLLNFITNGICYGFTDYSFPNYNIGGATGFLAYYAPKLLVCILPIMFAFTLAFMLSVVIKNIAVSIAVPFVFFVSSIILMSIMAYSQSMTWLVYTPIPFILMSQFFQRYSTFQYAIESGINISLTYGALLLAVLAVVCTSISVFVFRKRDIVN